jgi:hypothetical protein
MEIDRQPPGTIPWQVSIIASRRTGDQIHQAKLT